MEKMLINANQPEEIRVALVKDHHLYDLDIDCLSETKKKGNIYKARITRREPSLDAVFVEYGSKKQGFLPLKEISSDYFSKKQNDDANEKLPVTALLKDNQEVLIQIEKEERGNKGAAITTFITLAGCYLVLMPNSPKAGGISRRIEGDERDDLKETLQKLVIPDGMGVIIRTAGVGKSTEELQLDLDMLINQWAAIQKAYDKHVAPCLIHQESDVLIRAIRDNLRKNIDEIIIDDHVTFIKAKNYIQQVNPSFLPNLKYYNSNIPLFTFYQIESQIETAYQRQVMLKSGGSIVIDRTEALVSVDVNSSRATGGADIETTALNTNLEAADEIARQVRLRDLGGLIVIDFIDMGSNKHQRDVENRLKEALVSDRARIQVGKISRFGLLEMSRQRLRLSLGESSQDLCPRCEGRGSVRSIQSQSLSIMRLIEEKAIKNANCEIQVQLPVDMATFIMNEKREILSQIEKRHNSKIIIIANPYLQTPSYHISFVNLDDNSPKKPSFSLIEQPVPQIIRASEINSEIKPAVDFDNQFAAKSMTKQTNALELGGIKKLVQYIAKIFKNKETPEHDLKPEANKNFKPGTRRKKRHHSYYHNKQHTNHPNAHKKKPNNSTPSNQANLKSNVPKNS